MAGSAESREAAQGAAVEPIPLVKQRGRRWRVKLSNGERESQLDSHWARISRCNKRVKAWVEAIPTINRRQRRIYKAKGIAPRLVMITLTYGDAETEHKKSEGWEPNHIRDFMLGLRKLLGNKLWAYARVAEMQTRGSLHYHIMMYVAPGTKIPKPDEAGLWPHGMTKIETVKRGPWYILKYAGKDYQKDGLPAGARMFAVWVDKKQVSPDEIFGFRLSAAPPYVQEAIRAYFEKGDITSEVRWGRVVGGGWVIKDLGEMLQSEWYVVSITPIETPLALEGKDDGGG
jgi:hypothetical protein